MADHDTNEHDSTLHDPTQQDPTQQDPTQQQERARSPRRGWHDTDVTSLVFGLLFVGGAAVWALVQADVVSWPDAPGFFPVLLVVAGVIGLLSSVRRSRRARRDDEPQVRQ